LNKGYSGFVQMLTPLWVAGAALQGRKNFRPAAPHPRRHVLSLRWGRKIFRPYNRRLSSPYPQKKKCHQLNQNRSRAVFDLISNMPQVEWK
jgi:hypothetical protein